LTTPDCDEVVNWYVIDTPYSVTEEELEFFNITYTQNSSYPTTGNARGLQLLNDRPLKRFCDVYKDIPVPPDSSPAVRVALFILGLYIALFFYTTYKKYDEPERSEEPTLLSLHPLYSLFNAPNRTGFSMRARMTLLFVSIMTQFAIESSLVDNTVERNKTLVYYAAIYGVLASAPRTYIMGVLYRTAYKKLPGPYASSVENRQMWFFKICFYVFAWAVLAFDFSEICKDVYLYSENTNYLLILSLAVGMIVDFVILDFVIIGLAYLFPFMVNIFKWRGYYFEDRKIVESLMQQNRLSF